MREDKVEDMIVMLGLISFMAGRQTSKGQRGLFELNRKPCQKFQFCLIC